MPNVLNCADVTDCSITSWDLLFCICNGGGCEPAGPLPLGTDQDGVDGLKGVYSTTCNNVSTAASTGGGSAGWSNLANAQADDGTFATCSGDSATSISPGSQYIVLTDFGFAIPDSATIVGIAVGIKGKVISGGTHNPSYAVYNGALASGGALYYHCDPRGDAYASGYAAASPYPSAAGVNPFFTQPYYLRAGGFGYFFPSGFGDPTPVIDLIRPPTGSDPTGAGSYVLAGFMPGCSGEAEYGALPVQKDFWVSTLKQSWTPAEVNDPSFGAALSIFAGANTSGASFGLDCMGVAIYYTGGTTVTRRRPNVCLNM